MKLDNITFTPGINGAEPETVTVTMTLNEALWVALLAGKQRGSSSTYSDIYSCLVGDVFNRYWSGGTGEALRQHPVEIPPIVYFV